MHLLPHRKLDFWTICLVAVVTLSAGYSECRDKKEAVQYGAGLIVNVPEPEADVVKAVQEVVQNGLIRGSKEYSKDQYISGAAEASDSHLFPHWTEGGKIFYKVRTHALDPLNFKNGGDMGTLAVRYIVMGQDEKHTVLKIDALFAEDFRHTVHPSNGSVEGAEYKDIHDHLESAELMKQEAIQAEKQKQESTSQKPIPSVSDPSAQSLPHPEIEKPADPAPQPVLATGETPEAKLKDLRHQLQRRVKPTGTALKAAPYQSASTLQALSSGTEVLVEIVTPYWFGVETHEGQHGWIPRDQLEDLP
jgi:hypothetical protein